MKTGDVMIDAAAFTVAMRDANIDKEFSGRLFEFLDEGARIAAPKALRLLRGVGRPLKPWGVLCGGMRRQTCFQRFGWPACSSAASQLRYSLQGQ